MYVSWCAVCMCVFSDTCASISICSLTHMCSAAVFVAMAIASHSWFSVDGLHVLSSTNRSFGDFLLKFGLWEVVAW